MKKRMTLVVGICFAMTVGSGALLGQGRRRQATGGPQNRPLLTRDQREDIRDRREDVRDRRDRRNGGIRDRREDVRDHREDLRDRVEDRFDRRPEGSLPPRANLRNAAAGFRDDGQFIAAANVSKNLNIPFHQLKATMLRGDGMSLGQAIHQLRPDLAENDIREATRRAERP